jgi:MFS family permease
LSAPYPRPRYAWYVVGVLMVAYVFSFIDRQILNLLVGPIRRDLGISDTGMSVLMGFSFAVFYTAFGLPLGRIADSRSRRGLIGFGMAFWSLMTAGCGLAQRYWQLLLLRIGVGVGEASLSPAAYSLIMDYFPPARRSLAISVYSMAIYLGAGLALLLGGVVVQVTSAAPSVGVPLLGEIRSWQAVMLAVGLPGILAALLLLTVREPQRRGNAGAGVPPVRVVVAYFRANLQTFSAHNIGFALLSLAGYGASAWVPTLYIRRFGWTAGEAGIRYGLLVTVCGTLGTLVGGWLADRWRRRGVVDANLRVGVVAAVGMVPLSLGYTLSPQVWTSFGFLAGAQFLAGMPWGVAAAAVQEAVPASMRGQASALYLFAINLIGLGIGPTAVALATDQVFRNEELVHYSLALVTVAAQVGALVLLLSGLAPFRRTISRLAATTAGLTGD